MANTLDQDGEPIVATKLFDESWYEQAYPDVKRSGLSAANHYARYGFRMGRRPSPHLSGDPNVLINALRLPAPKPGRVLVQAHQISAAGDDELGLAFALMHASELQRPAIAGLLANRASRLGDQEAWLQAINHYLERFALCPINLAQGDGLLINRLSTAPLPASASGPLVSVLMSAWNAAQTVEAAARSVLEQTYQNLELLIVDDCSDDSTWKVLVALAARDARIKIFRNAVNVGPYVCRNYVLGKARGAWITCQDADDWSHPQRLERHMAVVLAQASPPVASWSCMVRMSSTGLLQRWGVVGEHCFDGLARRSFVGALFEADALHCQAGGWDSVRFGGDGELISRFKAITGEPLMEVDQVLMLCMDLESGLTRHPDYGICPVNGLSAVRQRYREAYQLWHQQLSQSPQSDWRLPFPPQEKQRRFPAPDAMDVSAAAIRSNLFAFSSS